MVSYPPHNISVICHSVAGCSRSDLVGNMYHGVKETTMGYTFEEGTVTYSGLSEDSTATYMPNKEYVLSNGSSDVRTCQNNGLWSGRLPIFVRS